MKHAGKLPSPSRGASSSPPAHHRLSRAIAKTTPQKIRIVHELAPEVITTEARHFRELVQRLTGMPRQNGSCASSASTGSDASPSPSPSPPTSVTPSCARRLKLEAESSPPSPSSGEGGGFLRALEMDGYNDGLYQGLEGFLFDPSCDMDGAGGRF